MLKKIEWIRSKVSWLFKSASDGVDKLSEEARKHPEFSATGGGRNANWSIPTPTGNSGNTTYVTVEGAKVNQNIVTNDAVKAGNIAAAGVNKVGNLKQTHNNLAGVYP